MKDRYGLRFGLLGLPVLALAAGCQMSDMCCSGCSSQQQQSQLPRGFRPMQGYEQSTPGSSHKGWPRYIYSTQDRMVMAYVPSQTIVMGGGAQPDEGPERHVRVNHFYVDLHEVTNAQFDCFVRSADDIEPECPLGECGETRCFDCGKDNGCVNQENNTTWIGSELCFPGKCFSPWEHREVDPDDIRLYRRFWTPSLNNHHPVRNVSWREAWYYSRWAGKLLPSEAQWEAAARGDDGRVYPWGNENQSEVTRYLCNSKTSRDNWDGYEYTAPVMSYAPGVSPVGAFNMSGNVREWCGDWYDPGRYAYPSDEDPPSPLARGIQPFGDRHYPNPDDKDMADSRVGPYVGAERAIRGGSFADPIERCRVDSRWAAGQDMHLANVGFRTILPLPPES